MVQETCRDKAERLALVRDLSLVRDPPQRHDSKAKDDHSTRWLSEKRSDAQTVTRMAPSKITSTARVFL